MCAIKSNHPFVLGMLMSNLQSGLGRRDDIVLVILCCFWSWVKTKRFSELQDLHELIRCLVPDCDWPLSGPESALRWVRISNMTGRRIEWALSGIWRCWQAEPVESCCKKKNPSLRVIKRGLFTYSKIFSCSTSRWFFGCWAYLLRLSQIVRLSSKREHKNSNRDPVKSMSSYWASTSMQLQKERWYRPEWKSNLLWNYRYGSVLTAWVKVIKKLLLTFVKWDIRGK